VGRDQNPIPEMIEDIKSISREIKRDFNEVVENTKKMKHK